MTAVDLLGAIPDLPDAVEMMEKLQEIAGRFGFQSVSLSQSEARPACAEGRALLVRWNRETLERRVAENGPADLSDREHGACSLGTCRAPGALADRWAVVAATPANEALSPAEIAVLRLLGTVIDERLRELARGRPEPEPRPLLSRRERECLEWTAAGKTTWEIAAILDISQNTIDGYITSAMRKLGAVNRSHAVAVALRRHLID